MKTTEFADDVRKSHSADTVWLAAYAAAFSGFSNWDKLKGKHQQEWGDRIIYLDESHMLDDEKRTSLYIEEKNNWQGSDQINFETKSVEGDDGWVIYPKRSHYYAFLNHPRKYLVLFPTALIPSFWESYGDSIIARHGIKKNRPTVRGVSKWQSAFVPVPVSEVSLLLSNLGAELMFIQIPKSFAARTHEMGHKAYPSKWGVGVWQWIVRNVLKKKREISTTDMSPKDFAKVEIFLTAMIQLRISSNQRKKER